MPEDDRVVIGKMTCSPLQWAGMLAVLADMNILPDVQRRLAIQAANLMLAVMTGQDVSIKIAMTFDEMVVLRDACPNDSALKKTVQSRLDEMNAFRQIEGLGNE